MPKNHKRLYMAPFFLRVWRGVDGLGIPSVKYGCVCAADNSPRKGVAYDMPAMLRFTPLTAVPSLTGVLHILRAIREQGWYITI